MYSDDRVTEQVEHVDKMLAEENIRQCESVVNEERNVASLNRVHNIMDIICLKLESIDDYLFRLTGGLRSRL